MLNSFTVWQKGELDRSGVKAVLNTEVTSKLVHSVNPDAIIYAAGADPLVPQFLVMTSRMSIRPMRF